MVNRKFQSGSKPRRWKSGILFWRDNRISGKLSLANLLRRLNWINLLKTMKLVVEILEKIRNLIFCEPTPILYIYGG